MIDIKTERLINANQAAKIPPPGRGGKQPHISFFIRKFQTGEIEALRFGSRWVTSVEAIERWLSRQTAEALGQPAPPPARTSAARQRHLANVEKQLDVIGI